MRIDLVELSGRALQPLLHLFPGGFHHHECVGIEVEIGGITEGQLAFFHLNDPDLANLPVLSAAAPFKVGGRKNDPASYVEVEKGQLTFRNAADLYLYR